MTHPTMKSIAIEFVPGLLAHPVYIDMSGPTTPKTSTKNPAITNHLFIIFMIKFTSLRTKIYLLKASLTIKVPIKTIIAPIKP